MGTRLSGSTDSPRIVSTGLTRERGQASGGPIRVLSIIDNMDVGGTEMNALRTAERLDRTRYDLTVATLRADGPLRARYEAAGIPVHEFPLASLVGVQAAREGRRFAALLRGLRTEVLHSHDVYTNIFAIPWARWAGVPLVIGSRRWWHDVNRSAHRVMNRLSYRLAHRILANSPAVGELLVRGGISRERLLVIPNFVDDDAFEAIEPAAAAATRRELGVLTGELVVGVVANLRPVKDHATLLRAAARLTSDWPNVRYVLVGEGSTRSALEAQAATLGITNRVTFVGARAHQPGLQQLFDVAVLCSTDEAFPNTVVEAMAAGCPVVASRVGGVPDAVVPEETGLLVSPGNDAELARAIDTLLRDGPRREAMGRAGRERARALYHAPAVMSLIHATYDTVRTSRGASR